MTASGITHVETPIAGLVDLALQDPSLADVARRASDRPSDLTLIGPASARVFAASALAHGPFGNSVADTDVHMGMIIISYENYSQLVALM